MSVGVRPQSHVSVPSHRPAVQPVRQDRSARRQKSILGAVARWLWHFLGYTLFALMLVVPTQLQVVKLALMIFLLVSIIVYSGVRRTWDIHPYIVRWTLIMVVMGGGGVFLGWIRNAPGALQNITVYVMWPLVFLVFIAGIGKNLGLIEGMLKVMILATLVSSLITLRIIVITGDPWLISRLIPVIAPDFDYGRFQRYPVNTLIFLLPFVMTATLLWTKQWERIGWYGWFLIATFFGLAAAVAWNRRALWAIVVLAPLIGAKIAYGFASRTQPKLSTVSLRVVKVLIVGIVSLLILFFFWHDNFDALIQRFSNIFMLEIFDENSDLIRQQQLETLFVGWLRHPLFGTGFGAAIPGPLRSEEMPWASELSYFLLLYNTGIIGFLVYSSGVAWIIWTGIRVARSWRDPGRFMVPLLTGMVCFLIANVSNPYLAKYDYMWTLFLPIACINYWLLTECTPENRNR